MFKRRKPDSIEGNEAIPPRVGEAGASEGLLDGGALSAGLLGAPNRSADNGLGVPPLPPFRPAPPNEVPAMGRTPYPPPTPSGPVPQPPLAPAAASSAVTAPPPPSGPRLAVPSVPPRPREVAERRTLVVGRGIAVQGTVQDAERLVVEGTVEASMIHAAELAIAPGGTFKGEAEVGDAEVAGTMDGTLTARGNLVVRATGRVTGTARCRRLQVEDGGQITGRVEMLGESAPQPASRSASQSGVQSAPQPAPQSDPPQSDPPHPAAQMMA